MKPRRALIPMIKRRKFLRNSSPRRRFRDTSGRNSIELGQCVRQLGVPNQKRAERNWLGARWTGVRGTIYLPNERSDVG